MLLRIHMDGGMLNMERLDLINGVAQNLYGNWLIKNGKVDFSNSGVLQVNSKSFLELSVTRMMDGIML